MKLKVLERLLKHDPGSEATSVPRWILHRSRSEGAASAPEVRSPELTPVANGHGKPAFRGRPPMSRGQWSELETAQEFPEPQFALCQIEPWFGRCGLMRHALSF